MQYIMKYPSMVGELTVVSDGTNITELWMSQQKYYAATVEGRVERRASIHSPICKRVAGCIFFRKKTGYSYASVKA